MPLSTIRDARTNARLTVAQYARLTQRAHAAALRDARLFAQEFPGEFVTGDWDAEGFTHQRALQGYVRGDGSAALWPLYQRTLRVAVARDVARRMRPRTLVHRVPGAGPVRFEVAMERFGARPQATVSYPAGLFERVSGATARTGYPHAAIAQHVSRALGRPVAFAEVLDTAQGGAFATETWRFAVKARAARR